MTDRVLLLLSGLAGLALVWLLVREDRERPGREDRSVTDRLLGAWVGGNPFAGAIGIGWLLVGSLGLISVGLFSFGS